MTTTLTIIVILAMLWLAWPRNPKVDVDDEPRPALPLLLTRQQIIERFAVGDLKRISAVPVSDNRYACYLHPKDPPLELKEEA